MSKTYDVVIVGAGPGGYAAGLYCARGGLSAVILEKLSPGGQMGTTEQIDNYPGFDEGINGVDLTMQMQRGAERFGAHVKMEEVKSLDLAAQLKSIATSETTYCASAVIISTGAYPRELGLPGERELRGKGISYCATCDGALFRNKVVAVVGGGNTAAMDALFLSKFCQKVYLIHRRDTLRASKVYHSALQECQNLTFLWNTQVTGLIYADALTGIQITDKNKKTEQLDCDGLFIAIGAVPNTELVKGQLAINAEGYIVADESTCTSVPGVFAVGDVRTKPLRQIITAAADGAVAAQYAEEYCTTQNSVGGAKK